jgi:hypothetical protein
MLSSLSRTIQEIDFLWSSYLAIAFNSTHLIMLQSFLFTRIPFNVTDIQLHSYIHPFFKWLHIHRNQTLFLYTLKTLIRELDRNYDTDFYNLKS